MGPTKKALPVSFKFSAQIILNVLFRGAFIPRWVSRILFSTVNSQVVSDSSELLRLVSASATLRPGIRTRSAPIAFAQPIECDILDLSKHVLENL